MGVSIPIIMRASRYWNDEGIVLRASNFSENDRIVTLYTRKKGRITAMAKGARKIGNRFGSTLDCLSVSRFQFYSNQGMPYLTQSDVLLSFRDFCRDTPKWLVGCYFISLVDQCFEAEEGDERVFDTILQFLEYLSRGSNLRPLLLKFRILLLHFLGIYPRFQYCSACGSPLEEKSRGWSTRSGGRICEKCSPSIPDNQCLFPDILTITKTFLTNSCAACIPLRLNDRQFVVLDELLSQYLSYHVGKEIMSWKIFTQRFRE
ncbi:MAG: DNA repair protein RecO [Atribacterota bacterium]|nr:DNA repair protein RecO [Candidatus Atribacteria bacterium]